MREALLAPGDAEPTAAPIIDEVQAAAPARDGHDDRSAAAAAAAHERGGAHAGVDIEAAWPASCPGVAPDDRRPVSISVVPAARGSLAKSWSWRENSRLRSFVCKQPLYADAVCQPTRPPPGSPVRLRFSLLFENKPCICCGFWRGRRKGSVGGGGRGRR